MNLKRRLTLGVVAVVGVTITGFSLAASFAFSRGLKQELDARLMADAHALAGMVEEHAEAPWEFEGGGLDDFEVGADAAYFELWFDDGTVLARSPSLGSGDLPASTANGRRVTLPNGTQGQLEVVSLQPRQPEDAPAQPSGRKVRVAVARPTGELDALLLRLDEALLGAGLGAIVLAAFAAAWAVRRGLAPVSTLAHQLDAIDAQRLSTRVNRAEHPEELHAAVDKVNELVARLEAAFNRAQQFNADVAHELRTPLAGIKSIAEVALSKDRDVENYRAALTRSLRVTDQLTALVESLLLLSRLGAKQVPVRLAPLALRALVDECFAPFSAAAAARALTFENAVAEGAVVESDETALRMIATNLISNAVAYTAPGGRLIVEGAEAEALLRVRDSGPTLEPADLERIFGAFVRLDGSRTDTGAHCGIGLTLTRALAETLSLEVTARNVDGWLHFVVSPRRQ